MPTSVENLAAGRHRWLERLAVVLLAVACVALGRIAPAIDVVIIAALLAAAAVAPPLALLTLIAANLMSPLALPTGTHTDLNVAVMATAAFSVLWLARVLWRRDFSVFRLPTVQALCALALIAALAGALGNIPAFGMGHTAPIAAQLGGVAVFVFSAAAAALAADGLRDERWLRRATWLFLVCGAVLIGGRFVPEITEAAQWLFTSRADGSLTWTWFAALAGAQAILNRTLPWQLRLLLAMAVGAELFYGLGEGRAWVAGWFPPLVAVGIVVCLAAPRIAAVAIGLGGVVAALNLPRLLARFLVGDNQYSLDTRVDAARILLGNVVAARPLLGLGPANYYHVVPQFPIRGYAVNFSSHNTYVDLLAQTGIIGLLCFAVCVWAVARAGWQLHDRVPDGFARAYVVGALGGLAGTLAAGLLGDWVFPFVYNITLAGLRSSLLAWVFIGGMLALGRSVEMPRAPQRASFRPTRWTTRRILIGIAGVAVLLRLAVAIALGDTANEVSGAADQYSYDVLAQRVLQGHGFSFPTAWYPFALPNTPTAHWSYAYTLFLAAVYGLAGHHPLIARLIQVLASCAGCWLIFRIGRRLFDERVGLTAAALTAVYAYFVFFNAALMTQTFFILALLAAIDRALAIAERPTLGTWAALGACLGVGVLLRQTLLLYIPLLLGWLVWVTYGRLRWRDFGVALVVVALFIAPWTLRNYVAYGDFLLLNSNGGYFLWASNHPSQGTSFDPVHIAPVPAALQGAPEPVIDRALFRAAAGFIADDPIRFVRLSMSRVGSYFWLLPARSSPPLSNLARLGSFTLYSPFMLYGLVLSRARWRMCLPLYLYVGVDTALHLGSWAAPRYRLPSDALLMVFAGLAVVDLARRLRRPAVGERRAAKLLRAVAIAGAAATCVAPSARALDTGQWSPPREIFRGVGRTVSPLLISDPSGDVHLFFVTGAEPSEADTLMYARHPAEGEWSEPVPLAPPAPGHHIAFPAIALDQQGWLHIVYQGPRYNRPEYQHVHLSRITDPREWSHSTMLSSSGVFSSQIVAAPDGRLHVVYATPRDGIVYRSSDDRGRSWSDEVSVSATDTKGQGWNLPSLDIDPRGRLHLAWTQYALPTAWPPTGVFYARSLDNGATWTVPLQIAARDNGEATLFAPDDSVDLAWNGVDSGARMYASSNDGGGTWSAPQPVDDELRGGSTGPPHLAIDAADRVHLFTAANRRAGGEDIAHLALDGSAWSAPEWLSVDDTARSIRQPAVAVADGNHLYAAFHVDERAIFVTDMRLDAPTLTRRPVPTMTSGWRARIAGSSPRLRIVVAVLALLALEAAAEYGWRTWRRSRR